MDCCSEVPGDVSRERFCDIYSADSGAAVCPECGGKGRQIDVVTLKALLTARALRRLTSGEYRFCPDAKCGIVYFGNGLAFRTHDVMVPVWQKSKNPSDYVCYCFEHSEESIRREMAAAGYPAAPAEIKQLVKDRKCACEVRNPQGTCCLGNVAVVVTRVASERNNTEITMVPSPPAAD